MSQVHEAMAAVTKAVSYIAKEKSSGVKYEFRGIDAVMNHLHGPLADNGLVLSPRVLDDWQVNMIPGTNDRVQAQALFRICVDVYAEDGSMLTLGPGLAQSHDYGDKAVYQAQQNAIKYLLLEAFAIPTAEQDMDAREADAVPHDEVMPKATNQIKSDILEMVEGDARTAQEIFEAAATALGINPDQPVPKSKLAEMQVEVEARSMEAMARRDGDNRSSPSSGAGNQSGAASSDDAA